MASFVEAAVFEVRARNFAFRRAFKLLHEKRLRFAMHFHERGALLIFLALFGRALSGPRDRDAAFFRDDAHGFRKRTLVHFHHELEDVAADAAAKAVVNLLRRDGRQTMAIFRSGTGTAR